MQDETNDPTTEDPGAKQTEGEGGEGRRNIESTPEVADDAADGQTQADAPDDDAGGARDEPSRTD